MILSALALLFTMQTVVQTPKSAPKVYRVPYRLTDTQHLLVRAKINGKGPYNFMVDTGAPTIYLAPAIAKTLGIKSDARGWGKINLLEIEGGAIQKNVPAQIIEVYQMQGMNAMGLAGSHIDGIFGFTLLAQFRHEIDLNETVLLWTPTPFDAMAFLEGSLARAAAAAPPKQETAELESMKRMTQMISKIYARQGKKETVRRAFFGMELSDGKEAATVTAVLPASPAALAGLQAGDRITHIQLKDGNTLMPVTGAASLRTALATVVAERIVIFTVWRGSTKTHFDVTGKEGL